MENLRRGQKTNCFSASAISPLFLAAATADGGVGGVKFNFVFEKVKELLHACL